MFGKYTLPETASQYTSAYFAQLFQQLQVYSRNSKKEFLTELLINKYLKLYMIPVHTQPSAVFTATYQEL